jgi:hypothetical protein
MAPSMQPSQDADEAIARVLRAERDARESVEQARREVAQIAEASRVAARTLAERTERRSRALVAAFERDLAARLVEIDGEAARLDSPQPLAADEQAAVQRVVATIARELTTGRR